MRRNAKSRLHLTLAHCLVLALALGLAGALAGCQRVVALSQEFDPRLPTDDAAYQEKASPYLAKCGIYQGPATQALIEALPMNPAVRRAMVQRRAAAFGWEPARVAQETADAQAAAADGLTVALALFTAERKENNLTDAKPTYRLWLEDAQGGRALPVDVRVIRDRSPINQSLYWFWGPWSKLYLVRFAAPAGFPAGGKARLVVTGAPGRTTLELDFK